jgi:phenylalanyl-tRNA synthetase alpha chain
LLLTTIEKNGQISDTWDLAIELGIDHQILVGVVKSLLVDRYIAEESLSLTYWALTLEGEQVVEKGSPEIQVLNAVPSQEAGGISLKELQASLKEVAAIGMGVCMKNKWIKKDGDLVVRLASNDVKDDTASLLSAVQAGSTDILASSESDLKNLMKRKLVKQVTRKSSRITRGPDFKPIRVRKVLCFDKSNLGNKAEVPI